MKPLSHKPGVNDELADAGDSSAPLVLVIDDSPTETRILSHSLIKAGYRVEIAGNGLEGVEMARRLMPDMILMDVIMPALNGFQATRMLHRDESTARIPIIILSTKDQPTDRTWGLRQGAVDYLVKPVDIADLLGRIRAILGG
jgi:twitching motility two-component system response regulator PilH